MKGLWRRVNNTKQVTSKTVLRPTQKKNNIQIFISFVVVAYTKVKSSFRAHLYGIALAENTVAASIEEMSRQRRRIVGNTTSDLTSRGLNLRLFSPVPNTLLPG